MFKKSLILLTTTAIMLPVGLVPVSATGTAIGESVRQERAQRSKPKARSQRQQRAPRQRTSSGKVRKSQSSYKRHEPVARQPSEPQQQSMPVQRSAPRQQAVSRQQSVPRQQRDVRQQVTRRHEATSQQRASQRVEPVRERNSVRAQARSRARANTGSSTTSVKKQTNVTRVTRSNGSKPSTRAITRTSTRSVENNLRNRSAVTRRYSSPKGTRVVRDDDARRATRNVTRTTKVISRKNAVLRDHKDATGRRRAAAYATSRGTYTSSRSNRDYRRDVRSTHGGNAEYYTGNGRTRRLDLDRDRRGARSTDWDRGYDRARYRGSYRRDWLYQNRWYRDHDIYFGFSPFYLGFGFNTGYFNGHYNGYFNGHYFGRSHYYGHWPLSSGFYGSRARWGWNHSHHHYHYGSYCPHAHNNVDVVYDSHNYHNSYSSNSDTAVGVLLGGIVGGILGAEIDGGHNRTAGTVIGAIAGAAIGASIANADDGSAIHYPETGVVYDSVGRHRYEDAPYLPPREIKTCLRYETRNNQNICTKWTVEYVYDDEE